MLQTEILREIQEPELVDGVRVRKMNPMLRHGITQLNLGVMLRRLAPAGKVATEWRCAVESSVTELVPDVSFASRERLEPLSVEERELPPFAPDVAIEIRSPGDKQKVLDRKIHLYLTHGTLLVLDADPTRRTIVSYEQSGNVRRFAHGDRFESALVPWLAFDVAEAFAGVDEL